MLAARAVLSLSKASSRLFRKKTASESDGTRSESDGATNPSVRITDSTNVVVESTAGEEKSMPLLYSLAKRWAWPAVTFRCETHPCEVHTSIVDENGDNALHWACFGKPPLEAVLALLHVCPELARTANNQGLLPLHVACSYRASGQVIQALVEAYSEGAGLPSFSGSYPMHLLCDYGAPLESIQAVLQTEGGVESLSQVDQVFHRKPLCILNARKGMNEFHNNIRELRRERNKRESVRMAQLVASCKSLDFWTKASLLIRTEYGGRVAADDDEALVVHACAGIPDCPPALLEYALLLYPEQLMEPDENGSLPLHIAACQSSLTILADILQACPQASKIRNNEGLLPIQLAVVSGRTWSTGVGLLLAANASSLEALDIDERLYPIIWARLFSKHPHGGVGAVFESLVARPSVCQ